MIKTPEKPSTDAAKPAATQSDATNPAPASGARQSGTVEADTKNAPKEIGGRGGPDPTRYGDWEKAGRCVDF